MKKHLFYLPIVFSLLAIGCKDDPAPAPEPPTTEAVFISNEGIFPNGIGSLTSYSPNQNTVDNNIFQKANLYPAGAVVSSVYVDDDRVWIVANADGLVYVINSITHLVEAKFENLQSPRHVIKVSENRYWISDWGVNGVHVVNLKTKNVVKQLVTGFGPEKMLVHDGKVFIVNSGGFVNGAKEKDSTVTVYDAVADTIMASIMVGENPNSIVIDKEDKIWVLSSGIADLSSPSTSTFGDIRSINPDSLWVEDTLFMPDNQLRPNQLAYSEETNALYFLSQPELADVMKYTLGDLSISANPFIDGSFYSLGFDPILNDIYAGNKRNEGDAGIVYRYDEDPTLVQTLTVGQNPSGFGFK